MMLVLARITLPPSPLAMPLYVYTLYLMRHHAYPRINIFI
jgi:hypothetical protein